MQITAATKKTAIKFAMRFYAKLNHFFHYSRVIFKMRLNVAHFSCKSQIVLPNLICYNCAVKMDRLATKK